MGSPFSAVRVNEISATFKLTRDSQGASRSITELEDFRMNFREKRDPYVSQSAETDKGSSCITEHTFARTCSKLSITWFIIVATSNYPFRSARRCSFRKSL
jgi:hypothetical protein